MNNTFTFNYVPMLLGNYPKVNGFLAMNWQIHLNNGISSIGMTNFHSISLISKSN